MSVYFFGHLAAASVIIGLLVATLRVTRRA
jgi:hypothetical protein